MKSRLSSVRPVETFRSIGTKLPCSIKSVHRYKRKEVVEAKPE